MTWTSHPTVSDILRVPGYLFWKPSALTNEATWGTKLGYCAKGIEVLCDIHDVLLTVEETGDEYVYDAFCGAPTKISAVLRNYNATNLARLFPGMTSSTAIKLPGSILAGADLASYADYLLFVPDDTTNNPIMLAQKAIPRLKGKFKFSRVEDTIFPCEFPLLRKSNDADGILYIGPIAGAVLR